MHKPISKYFIVQWIKSWLRLLILNWPYLKARLAGYKYYIEVGIDFDPKTLRTTADRSPNTSDVEQEMHEIGAKVLMVRLVRRRSYRSTHWRLFAVFKDTESAVLFKLREGGGQLKKFDSWWKI